MFQLKERIAFKADHHALSWVGVPKRPTLF